MLLTLLAIVLFQTPSIASVSPPAIEWQQEYAGDIESISNVIQTNDGGYAFFDRGWQHGVWTHTPSFFYKIDASGNVTWKKTFQWFAPDSLVQASDGGYTILGAWFTDINTYESTPALLKTDSEGTITSVKNFSSYMGQGLLPTIDGGFTLLNQKYTKPRYSTSIIKINSNGALQWNSTFNGPGNFSSINSMIQTSDGGYALAGSTSFNGTNDTPNLYYWLVRTDSHGNILWNSQYGNGPERVNTNETQNPSASEGLNRHVFGHNQGLSVTETFDGGFVIAGIVYPLGNYSIYDSNADIFLVKTDSQGNMEWNQTLDGYDVSPIIQTSDGGVAIAVYGRIIKIDANGNVQWEKKVTFPSLEYSGLSLSYLIETADGALVLIGVGTTSQPWWGDVYMIKTEPFLPLPTPSPTPSATPLPTINVEAIALMSIIIGVVAVAVLLLHFKKRKH
jgi:hypothetical protein